jgi:hypothetical protein
MVLSILVLSLFLRCKHCQWFENHVLSFDPLDFHNGNDVERLEIRSTIQTKSDYREFGSYDADDDDPDGERRGVWIKLLAFCAE